MISNTQGFGQSRPWLGTSSAARSVQAARLALHMFIYRTVCFFLSHLLPSKLVFAVLRRVRPVALFGKTLVVTKADDVREVLERFDDFTLGDIIEPGMPWGTFLMTVDWRDQHAEERRLLQSVVDPAPDMARIRTIAAGRCREQIAAARANGRIDAVAQLLEPVAVGIAQEYFGIPPLRRSETRMAEAMRDLAGIIMVNPPVGSKPWIQSRDTIVEVTAQVLDRVSASKSAAASAPPDLLGRLVGQLGVATQPSWFNEDWIRRYLTGLLATGGATIVRAGAHTIDQLLAHPKALKRAQELAAELERQEQLERDGIDNSAAKSRSALRLHIHEALRFRPMLPLLVRDTPRETVIAAGTKRARIVPAGTRVIAPPLAAMFDPERVPDPWHFHSDRPPQSYVHFGQGARECFGKYIAETALLEIVRSLLLLRDLARASGRDGRVAYEGPAASGLVVTFRATSATTGRDRP